MSLFRNWTTIFRVPDQDPALAQAQYKAFSKQLPLMYFILAINTWGVAITHLRVAPVALTLWSPLALTALCIARTLRWWLSRDRVCPGDVAIRSLKRTNRLAWVISGAFTAWSLSLFPYGDAFMQGHIAFYMGLTVIGCIFCLLHLRSAAFIVTLVVDVAFVAFFFTTGNHVFMAMAVDIGLVSVAMLTVLCVQYKDFTTLVAKQLETQALSDENRRLANVDSLTDMPNRRSFFFELDGTFSEAEKSGGSFAVGLLDLDGFKPVNDVYGHAMGDQLLIKVGERLRELESSAFFSRLGGDEFAFIVRDSANVDLLSFGGRICEAMRVPFQISDVDIQISGSVGMAEYPEVGRGSMELYERADYALYQAKREKPGEAVIFSSQQSSELSIIAMIDKAFRNGSFEESISLDFQPITDINSGRIVAFEALARWRHETYGVISPSLFIPATERLGFTGPLTRALLRKALVEAARWPSDIRLSFNLSAKDISSPDQAMQLLSIILTSNVDPRRIDLEVTETAVLADLPKARAVAQTLKASGVAISLDDFGTGYSSLTQLHQMPLDKIKIDRSFVTGIETNQTSLKIVKSLIGICREMEVACVVEGVETESELRTVRSLGGSLVQGFYFSRPVSGNDAFGMVSNEQPGQAEAGLKIA